MHLENEAIWKRLSIRFLKHGDEALQLGKMPLLHGEFFLQIDSIIIISFHENLKWDCREDRTPFTSPLLSHLLQI